MPIPLRQGEGLVKVGLKRLGGNQGQMNARQNRQGVGLPLRRAEQDGSRLGNRRVRYGHSQVAFGKPPPVAAGGDDLHAETLQQIRRYRT